MDDRWLHGIASLACLGLPIVGAYVLHVAFELPLLWGKEGAAGGSEATNDGKALTEVRLEKLYTCIHVYRRAMYYGIYKSTYVHISVPSHQSSRCVFLCAYASLHCTNPPPRLPFSQANDEVETPVPSRGNNGAASDFIGLSYGLLPLVWGGNTAHYLEYFLREAPNVLPVAALTVGVSETWAGMLPHLTVSPDIIGFVQVCIYVYINAGVYYMFS